MTPSCGNFRYFELKLIFPYFWGWKTRDNVVVLDFLAVDNFDFTRKIVKKILGEKLVKMLGACQNWIFGQKFDFWNSVGLDIKKYFLFFQFFFAEENLLWQARYSGNSNLLNRAHNYATPSCDQLERIYSYWMSSLQLHSVWKSQKKSHSTLRAKWLHLHFEWTKVH